MRKAAWVALVAMCASLCVPAVAAQQKPEKAVNPAQLELTMEVAATTEEGYPSVLRVTVKNVGNVAVDMPMPVVGCLPHGGHVSMHLEWRPNQSKNGDSKGWGEGCGEGEGPSLMDRIHDEWIHLRPGEFVISSENLHERLGKVDPGTIEYWVEYVPPEVSTKKLAELQLAGYVVPTEKIETAHLSFVVH